MSFEKNLLALTVVPCDASPLPGVLMGTSDLSGKFPEEQREEGKRLPESHLWGIVILSIF